MPLKRQIKTQLVIFTVFLTVFIGTFLYLFQKNYNQFNQEIYKKSKDNLEIIDLLSKVDANLYIHKKSLFRYLNTGDPKWMAYLRDAETGIDKYFNVMEAYNKEEFNLWLPVQKSYFQNAREALKEQIIEFQKGRSGDDHFQRLFNLVRYNLEQYFRQSDELIKEYSEVDVSDQPEVISIQDEESYVKLIYVGVNQLVTVYNNLFWDYAQAQNTRYNQNTNYYFKALMLSSVFILLYAIFILMQVFRFFYKQQIRNENLALLGAKDLVTGLFNRRSFEILCSQELERAKRRGYHLSLLVVKIAPYDQMRKDLGEVALNRIVFQVAEMLQQTIRAYDGVFRYDENTFIVLFSETNFSSINTIVKRVKKRFYKTTLVARKEQTEVIPQVSCGIGIYPTDADNLNELVQFAMGNLSTRFDVHTSHAEPVVSEPFITEKKAAEPSSEFMDQAFVDDKELAVVDSTDKAGPESTKEPSQSSDEERFKPPVAEESVTQEPEVEKPVVEDSVVESVVEPESSPEEPVDPVEARSVPDWMKQELETLESANDIDAMFISGQGALSEDDEQDYAEEVIEEANPVQVPQQETQKVSQEVEPPLQEIVEEKEKLENDDEEIVFSDDSDDIEDEDEEETEGKAILPRQEDAALPGQEDDQEGAEDIPDVVAALTQDDDFETLEPEGEHIPEIEVVQDKDGEEEVIMVDFDTDEKEDLATNFRKKQRDRRKKAL